jgi:hypothetical protein
MNTRDRSAFLDGIEDVAGNNFRHPETHAAFIAVAETLADNCDSTTRACEALQLVIQYGRAVSAEAYDDAQTAIRSAA